MSSEVPAGSFSSEIRPVPFACVQDFLVEEEQQDVWKLVDDNIDSFHPARAGGKLQPGYRSARLLKDQLITSAIPWFLKRIRAELLQFWERIEVSPFGPGPEELQLTNHLDGEFYKVHKDKGITDKEKEMRVTFVYYFHSLPRQFSGGDLLLYDTDLEGDRVVASYTRTIPAHNTVVFFPSNYHQETPVSTDSSEIRDGRFTLNGWLHETDQTS